MKINFLGDIHGHFENILNDGLTIQVGDLGIGFADFRRPYKDFYYIRGNHDNPSLCREEDGYLGNFGEKFGVFYISGGVSPDRERRIAFAGWWPDEDLSYIQKTECLGLYRQACPAVVVSHESPFMGHSSMQHFLALLWDIHQPALWIHGHHHQHVEYKRGNTRFVGLGINEYASFDI